MTMRLLAGDFRGEVEASRARMSETTRILNLDEPEEEEEERTEEEEPE